MSEQATQTPENMLQCSDGVVTGADDIVSLWTQKKLGGGPILTGAVAIGVVRNGIADHQVDRLNLPQMLSVGVVFWNWQRGQGVTGDDVSDIMVSVATEGFDPRNFAAVEKVLRYPFEFWGLRRISAEIEAGNDLAVRQAQNMGFVREGVKRRAGPGGRDVLMFGLLPEECPFWKRRAA